MVNDSWKYRQDRFTFKSLHLENIFEENLWKHNKLARKLSSQILHFQDKQFQDMVDLILQKLFCIIKQKNRVLGVSRINNQ